MIIPRPSYSEKEVTVTIEAPVMEHINYLRAKNYFDTGMSTKWKCPKCKATMFGHLEFCAYCRIRYNIQTARP